MSNIQVHTPQSNAIASTTATSWLDDPAKVALIKDTVAVGTTDLELALFLEVCKSTGLNPFQKQIYAIRRAGRMTIQTGIDGYRLIASRTNAHAGTEEAEFGTGPDGRPEWARVSVLRLVQGHIARFTATARWSEYAQLDREGRPTDMWKRMPHTMLAKCAEALALRKAFPAELSGVYTKEEMMQAENDAPTPVQRIAPAIAEPDDAALTFATAVRVQMMQAPLMFTTVEIDKAYERALVLAASKRDEFMGKLKDAREARLEAQTDPE